MADYKVTYKRYSGGAWHNIYFETPVSVIAATGTRNSSSALFGDGTWKGVALLSGDQTISGLKTFNNGIVIPGQNNYIDIGKKDNWFWTRFSGENWTFNNTFTGGGWARNLMEMRPADPEEDAYLRIGAQGSGQNFTHMYIGPAYNNYWLSLNDDRALFRAKPQYASDPTSNNDLTRKSYVDGKLNTKQDALGYTAENTANKRTSIRTSGATNTSYVSELGVKTYVDGQIGSVYRPAGDWNAATNSPALANNTPANSGKVYRVSTAGTRFGFTFAVGDKLAFNEDGVISKWDNVDDVTSVNGQAGTVVLTTDDIDEGSNLYVSQSEKNTWNAKQNTITGAATTITSGNLAINRVVISNAAGKVVASDVTTDELGRLSGVEDNIQTQLDDKLNLAGGDMAGPITMGSNNITGNNSSVFQAGRIIATNSNTSAHGITSSGSRANMLYLMNGVTGGLAASLLDVDVKNTTTPQKRIAKIGIYGSATSGTGGTPSATYLWLSSVEGNTYNLDATLKVDANNRIGIALSGANRPTQALDVNGKIRMRTSTVDTDGADIVVTKDYMLNKILNNTPSSMLQSDIDNGTTNNRVIRASLLNANFYNKTEIQDNYVRSDGYIGNKEDLLLGTSGDYNFANVTLGKIAYSGGPIMYLNGEEAFAELYVPLSFVDGATVPDSKIISDSSVVNKKYVDEQMNNKWKQIFAGTSPALSKTDPTFIPVPSDTYAGKTVAIEIRYWSDSATSYTNRIIFVTLGTNSSTESSKTYPRFISFSEFDGRYLKHISTKCSVASGTTSIITFGFLKTLIGSFSGTTIDWTTQTSDSLSVYIGKIWVLE